MLFVMLVVPFSHQDLTEKLGMDTFPNKDNSVEQPNLEESNVMEPYSRPCNPTTSQNTPWLPQVQHRSAPNEKLTGR